MQRLLRAQERTLTMVGCATKQERYSETTRLALAIRRAETVRKWLVVQGLPESQLRVRTSGTDTRDQPPNGETYSVVTFDLAPNHPLRPDRVDPEWTDRNWCDPGPE